MERKGPESKGESSVTESAPMSKRPYKTPRLRRLGSVRELTFGITMGAFGDNGGGMMVGVM